VNARPIITAASGWVTRRKTQTAVIFLVVLVSTTAATLGLALLVTANGPFQRAFAAQHGADVAMVIDSARASDSQVSATDRVPGVTQFSGPFPAATAVIEVNGTPMTALTVGRTSPGGPLDDLTLAAGRWARSSGEVVLSSDLSTLPAIGSKVTVTTAPGKPQLTVVGYATSVTNAAAAWATPAEIAALRAPGAPPAVQALYQFTSAGSAAQVRADVASVSAALPKGAVTGAASWLTAQAQATEKSSVIAPFVVGFAIMGLAMAVLIVVNVVSGAVLASFRRIGVLKSIGFTPAQVVGAYTFRVGVPTLVASVIGMILGNVLAIPVLRRSAAAFGAGIQLVPAWVDVATPLLMCVLVAAAASLPALRAGRLNAVEAIATGYAPRGGHGYVVQRLAARIWLPRPLTLGLAAPFARPARALIMLTAIAVGTTAVVFAAGLDSSLVTVTQDRQATVNGQVQVALASGTAISPGEAPDRQATAAIRAQSGTLEYTPEADTVIGVAGQAQQVQAEALAGNTSWLGYDMISGRWYRGNSEADVNTAFLTQTGLSVGDYVTCSSGGRDVRLEIVGETFATGQPTLIASWQALDGGAAAGLTVNHYDISLRAGADPYSYSASLGQSLGAKFTAYVPSEGHGFERTALSLVTLLTLMIIAVAILGVLNTVLLGVRERSRDLGVFKGLGMTPRQMISMVICWVIAPAIGAGIIAVPVAITLHFVVVKAMAHAADVGIPADVMNVYGGYEVVLITIAGLTISALGALLPARWVARSTTVEALRTE
jgi:putative ABC transport system permease protein